MNDTWSLYITVMTLLFTYSDKSKLISLSAKAFIGRFPVWEANRTMDEAHVLDLEVSVRSPSDIQGPFSVISYIDDNKQIQNRVIDGQHRQEVLRRHFAKNPTDDFEILVRRYPITEHADAVALFQKINHAKPMIYRGSTTERLHEIVTSLKRRYIGYKTDGSAVALIRPSCNRPFLSLEVLEEALKKYKIHERPELTDEQILAHAEKMNAFYAEDIDRIGARCTKHTMDRATEYGFYLGLDPKCGWLLGLAQM